MGDLYRLSSGQLALIGALALALSLALAPRAAANAPTDADKSSADNASGGYIDHSALPPTTLPPTQSLRAPEPGSEAILIAQPPTEATASAPNWLYITGGALVFLGVLWILRGAPASQPEEPPEEPLEEPLPDTTKEPT